MVFLKDAAESLTVRGESTTDRVQYHLWGLSNILY